MKDFEGTGFKSPLILSAENREIDQIDLEHDESLEKATDELNTKFRPELQDKIDSIQSNDTEIPNPQEDEFRLKNSLKTVQAGLNTGNVNITWEADQKCIKPKITVNEKATKDEITLAVQNAEYAFVACMDSIQVLGVQCAPLPIPEPTKNKHSKKDMRDVDE